MVRSPRQDLLGTTLPLLLGVPGGFAAIALAWLGVARTSSVGEQLPWLVSGGIVGLAVIGTCGGLLAVHAERREIARHAIQMQALLREVTTLVNGVDELLQAPRGQATATRKPRPKKR